MWYFTIIEQNKRYGNVRNHEGTGYRRDQDLSVSKQLTIMYRYSIYEEGIMTS